MAAKCSRARELAAVVVAAVAVALVILLCCSVGCIT